MVFPRVLADKDVRPSDLEASNLILFGTKETNSVIAKFSEQLPIQLNTADAGYGLVYVFPAGEHYILVNSGLPWWSVGGPGSNPAQLPARHGFRPVFGPAGLLMDFQDYLLFKGSVDNMIAEGRFDRNWRVPEADIAKMQSVGVVTIALETTKPPKRKD
jgi:hypothetical protein